MGNSVVWVDIPVTDLDRAIRFYGAMLGKAVKKETFPGGELGVLPHEGGVGGCLVVMRDGRPSANGPLIYVNCDQRLDEAGAAVVANGGRLIEAKQAIGPHGFRTVVLDSEGNRIALHSM